MLIEFSVGNFRSFKERQTFSMVKGSGSTMEETNAFIPSSENNTTLLNTAAIYGANASGKSNLLKAVEAMTEVVVGSASSQERSAILELEPFLFCDEKINSPSEFEVVFIANNVRYQYGFTASTSKIYEEWLFAYPHGKAQKWFERTWEQDKNKYSWKLGAKLEGEKKLWQKSTRDEALFLSTAILLNSKQLLPVFNWFKDTVQIINYTVGGSHTAAKCNSDNENSKKEVLDFLRSADLGIHDIEVESKPFDPELVNKDMPDEVREAFIANMKDTKLIEVNTVHIGNQGQLITMNIREESDGTRKLFNFAAPWIDALKKGYVLFVDELHANLHPALVGLLVELFHDKKTNKNNAQLIFTTHETSILNQKIFRRDQIWFCEKDENHSTVIYPLTDFSPRKRENLELAYLSGKYGAIPFVMQTLNNS